MSLNSFLSSKIEDEREKKKKKELTAAMLHGGTCIEKTFFCIFFFCQKPGWVFVITEYEVRMKV